ncbi:hypothetical protein HBI80_054440 [Parastagonospora nodorum]|nr:hypothetical protein HBI80_054440 [Parastagonospora nodorum]
MIVCVEHEQHFIRQALGSCSGSRQRLSSSWLYDIQPNRKNSLPATSFVDPQSATPTLDLRQQSRPQNNATQALANFCVCARDTAPVINSFSGGHSGSRLGKVVPSTAEWRHKVSLCATASGSPMIYGGYYPPTAYGESPVYGATNSGPIFGHTSSHLEEVLLAETRSRLIAASPCY